MISKGGSGNAERKVDKCGKAEEREIVTGTRSIRIGAAGIGTGPEADRSRSRGNSNKKLLKRARTGTDRSGKGTRNRVGTGLEQDWNRNRNRNRSRVAGRQSYLGKSQAARGKVWASEGGRKQMPRLTGAEGIWFKGIGYHVE